MHSCATLLVFWCPPVVMSVAFGLISPNLRPRIPNPRHVVPCASGGFACRTISVFPLLVCIRGFSCTVRNVSTSSRVHPPFLGNARKSLRGAVGGGREVSTHEEHFIVVPLPSRPDEGAQRLQKMNGHGERHPRKSAIESRAAPAYSSEERERWSTKIKKSYYKHNSFQRQSAKNTGQRPSG